MPTWNKVRFDKTGEVYQEIDNGIVTRYVDNKGDELFIDPPVGESCRVVQEDSPPTPQMRTKGDSREAVKAAERAAARSDQTKALKNALAEALDEWEKLDAENARIPLLRVLVRDLSSNDP